MKLQDRVAVVTGASRSIGAAIAKRYALEGARVVVNYATNAELAQQVVDEIRVHGGEAFACCADVSQEEQVNGMVEETIRRFGRIDVLVNNAAIDPREEWDAITTEQWDAVMGANVRSQFLCAKAVFPSMREQGYGKIINVSSVTFFTGQKGYVHYVASKGAIIGLTRALAREVGEHGITVNCITPGAIHTETEALKIGEEASRQAGESLAKLQCFSRRGVAGDLEGAFLFLASTDSDFITGQILNVDGGWVMH
jgi:3-oxoacyl-[acyl-carrier protein] reductase